MDSGLFQRRSQLGGMTAGQRIKINSDTVMQKTFRNDLACKVCQLYDWDGIFLEDVEAKFLEPKEYSILKDQVEYQLEFRPDFHPEKKYNYLNTLGEKRMGFYIDIPDSVGDMERWLIWNRNDKKQFVKYSIVKTNWTFKWVADGVIHSCRGIVRDKNSYNSGIWGDDRTTSVDDMAMIVVPMTDVTAIIDYGMRFLLTTNKARPITYSISKRNDVFPIGIIKCTLVQDRFNPIKDNLDLMIADYYISNIIPQENPTSVPIQTIALTGASQLPVGATRVITVSVTDDILASTLVWTNNIPEDIIHLFSFTIIDQYHLQVSCTKNNKLIGTVFTIGCSDDTNSYTATHQMEVISL